MAKVNQWMIDPSDAVMLLIDHQSGLFQLVKDIELPVLRANVTALAKVARLAKVPTFTTASVPDGPNGPLIPEIHQHNPEAVYIPRTGQINAWDNPEFVDAIRKTGRKKIVMSGITTDVCVTFAALSALDAGYDVYVVVDASGCQSEQVQNAAITRMAQAGATIGTWFAVSCELLSDWRNPAGPGSAQLFVEHMPSYAEIFASHKAQAGTRKQ